MEPSMPTTPRKLGLRPADTPGSRRRRKIPAKLARGLRERPLPQAATAAKIKKLLKLSFDPADWQVELIRRIQTGYDSIAIAGTGYGKSLVFQGLAALGGKGKAVVVICPLKALEADQVKEAQAKGISAILVNEDNSDSPEVWTAVRTTAQLIYISPEMARSPSFSQLWKDTRFRSRLQAIIVDEAHCVDEWGADFRPVYRELDMLRSYTGMEIPFLACTATCTTGAFSTVWTSLGFGHRPYWGLDVGCDRANLFYLTRAIVNAKNPVLDILNILPAQFTPETPHSAIPKSIFYFDSEAACRMAVQTLRKCFPAHLRSAVQPFSSDLSEKCKAATWAGFLGDKYRIICATDAAGMGCNVPDVEYVINFGCPRSLSVLMQRWGRAGRDSSVKATCILLVPSWAFRPAPPTAGLAVQRLKGRAKPKLEPKRHSEQRSRLQPELEEFINLGAREAAERCAHKYMRGVFRPRTRLTTYRGVGGPTDYKDNARSHASAHPLSHTISDPERYPHGDRCCQQCNPTLPAHLLSSTASDRRLCAYASEFINPLVTVYCT